MSGFKKNILALAIILAIGIVTNYLVDEKSKSEMVKSSIVPCGTE